METATETNQNNRELTATEIKIAIAQIEDRLMRVVKAQEELYEWADGEPVEYNKLMDSVTEEEANEKHHLIMKEKCNNLRAKYEIPEGVHIFHPDTECGITSNQVKGIMPYIKDFVKGRLTEDAAWGMILYFEELYECDYGWVLIEQPMGFYDQPCDDDMDKITKEIISIGTRSRSKNKYLTKKIGSPFT
jgi:hypothetical protein